MVQPDCSGYIAPVILKQILHSDIIFTEIPRNVDRVFIVYFIVGFGVNIIKIKRASIYRRIWRSP
ncbi:hypothetical protein D3C85_941800 [compost metagenome]